MLELHQQFEQLRIDRIVNLHTRINLLKASIAQHYKYGNLITTVKMANELSELQTDLERIESYEQP